MRIRFDEGNEYRLDAIQGAADMYGVNRSDAVSRACEDATRLGDVLEDLLERDDLTRGQVRDLADELDRKLSMTVDVDQEVRIGD